MPDSPRREGCKKAVVATMLSLWLPATSYSQAQPGDSWVRQGLEITTRAIDATLLGGGRDDLAISADGSELAYSELHSDIGHNVDVVSLWLSIQVRGHATIRRELQRENTSRRITFSPRFSPDGRRLAYLDHSRQKAQVDEPWNAPAGSELIIVDTDAERPEQARRIPLPSDNFGATFLTSGVKAFAWSPDGRKIGFVLTGHGQQTTPAGSEVSVNDINPGNPESAPSRLVIYDLTDSSWTPLSPAGIDVDSLAWSPDGSQIVFAGSVGQEAFLSYMYNELYVVNLREQKARKIVSTAGVNMAPVWSPNGRWIAFQSDGGERHWLAQTRVGLYDVESVKTTYPGFEELGRISGLRVTNISWAQDSRSVLLTAPYRLSRQLFKVGIPDGTLARVSTIDDATFRAARYSSDGRSLYFVEESFTNPPEIYASSVKTFRPKRITESNPKLDLPDIDVRRLEWPSRDGRWTIHGWLLLPKGNVNRIPLLVYAEGGPAMPDPHFEVSLSQYPLRSFVANGVAVLIPNTRGHSGYGADFEKAWDTEQDCGEGSLDDVLSAVDTVVKAGIVDPERVALAGHSWGGYLAAYALTHTNQFKAILIHEAVNLNALDGSFTLVGSPERREFEHQLGIGGVPYKPEEADHLRRLSPVYQLDRAVTPSLLEFGTESLLKEGNKLFQGLKYFKVPTELISYPRTGHITHEPALRVDAARRELEWFAYWVLGKPTHRMLELYGPPRVEEWRAP
jgi:dipeptidyl aminopeptidase/acylaminoacyl peptidase